MNDLTFGTTLLACFAATVLTVCIEATTPAEPTRAAPAVAQGDHNPKRVAREQDKGCTTVAAAPIAAH